MNPSIWIYGGVHHDPGSRRRFVEELTKQATSPHFVAVEWEESVFQRFVACRPSIEESLRTRWDFLTSKDCRDLALALAWEGDAYKARFPDAAPLWLESGFGEARCDADCPKQFAKSLLLRLCNPCNAFLSSLFSNGPPRPDPQSKEELIDCVWRNLWAEASSDSNFERDKRWADTISGRIEGLHDGWIAIVVGWAHADPEGGDGRLRSLLLSKGFSIRSVCLGP